MACYINKQTNNKTAFVRLFPRLDRTGERALHLIESVGCLYVIHFDQKQAVGFPSECKRSTCVFSLQLLCYRHKQWCILGNWSLLISFLGMMDLFSKSLLRRSMHGHLLNAAGCTVLLRRRKKLLSLFAESSPFFFSFNPLCLVSLLAPSA